MRPRSLLPFHLCALSYARDYIGIEEVGGDNKGPAVEVFLRAAGIGTDAPWCAAFVNFCAEMAQTLKNERSPLEQIEQQAYVQAYYNWAKGRDILIEWDQIGPGDLFLIYHTTKTRYAHIGFVDHVDLDRMEFSTIEGNTNEAGGREGYMVAARFRPITDKMRFIRWA